MDSVQFSSFDLQEPLNRALLDIGYEFATPIQAECIPILAKGGNLLGTAQTGTGKTAAFALPLLNNVDCSSKKPQILVLTPTRELAIQVAEAFKSFSKNMKNLNVLPIYGGQSISFQLSALKRGAQVIVGTPGRTLDHLKKGSLNFNTIKSVVLDEADEMLQMGFIEDVESILSKTPDGCQVALFSATMPPAIQKVADTYLGDASDVRIKNKTATVENIEQNYVLVNKKYKLEALTRILDAEVFDAMIVFVRTRAETVELADRLAARGYAVAALNGDLDQKLREHTVKKLKNSQLDILIATDIAARGLDVVRITHVLNYDIPYDPETYIHRIGRTGRAGRKGKTILFTSPKERRLMAAIEKTTRQTILPLTLPNSKEISQRRIDQFEKDLLEIVKNEKIEPFSLILKRLASQEDLEVIEIAAALAWKMQEIRPLFPVMQDLPSLSFSESSKRMRSDKPARQSRNDDSKLRYRISTGKDDRIKPGDIVGALANEGDIDGSSIGEIQIFSSFSTVCLPKDISKKTIEELGEIKIKGKSLKIRLMHDDGPMKKRSRNMHSEHSNSKSGGYKGKSSFKKSPRSDRKRK